MAVVVLCSAPSSMSPFFQYPIDARPTDAELIGDLGGGAHALRLQRAHPRHVYRSRPALVDARGLGLGDALKLALPAKTTQKK